MCYFNRRREVARLLMPATPTRDINFNLLFNKKHVMLNRSEFKHET